MTVRTPSRRPWGPVAGLAAALLCVAAPRLPAQWSDSAATNNALADAASDQSQPKLAARVDGGVWLSWFDGIGTGWDVRVQRLDQGGVAQLGGAGILVADRGFSSTQDYGLAVAADGAALLAYRDDGGTGVQIAASRVEADGTIAWSTQVTATGAFVAAPKVAGLADGSTVVGWTQDATTRLRKLDAAGNLVGGELVLTPASGTYSISDMHAHVDDVIFSFVHQTGGFGSPRNLLANKLGAVGGLQWGAGHVSVFDGGSLQFGNFPRFVPDGSGGATFSWYDAGSSQLQVSVQRLAPDGSEVFPHDGVVVSTDLSRLRVSPWHDYDPSDGSLHVAWVELNANQSQSGVYAQRIDAAGNRLWGAAGQQIVAVGSDDIGDVRAILQGGEDLVTWGASPVFGVETLRSARLDDTGAVTAGPTDFASTASAKARVTLARTTTGDVALAWQDDRADAGDIYGQNLNEDGTLGARWADLGGATPGVDGPPVLVGTGSLAAGLPVGLALTHGPPSALCLLWISLAATPVPFFSGTVHALPFNAQLFFVTSPSGAVSGAVPMPVGFPPGSDLWFQFVLEDLTALPGLTISNGVRGTTP